MPHACHKDAASVNENSLRGGSDGHSLLGKPLVTFLSWSRAKRTSHVIYAALTSWLPSSWLSSPVPSCSAGNLPWGGTQVGPGGSVCSVHLHCFPSWRGCGLLREVWNLEKVPVHYRGMSPGSCWGFHPVNLVSSFNGCPCLSSGSVCLVTFETLTFDLLWGRCFFYSPPSVASILPRAGTRLT